MKKIGDYLLENNICDEAEDVEKDEDCDVIDEGKRSFSNDCTKWSNK